MAVGLDDFALTGVGQEGSGDAHVHGSIWVATTA
jgi:hypothetical protein